MTFAIFGNNYQGDNSESVIGFIRALSERAEVIVESEFRSFLESRISDGTPLPAASFEGTPEAADFALSFGGDGTFLNAAHAILSLDIPLMGINTGHLGYLAGANISDFNILIDHLLSGDYVVERRAMLQVEVDGAELDISRYALNEIAILKRNSASMIKVSTSLDGQPLADYQADGLIVATPTGSTAYNLSVGGPIVDPNARVTILSPVAPHTLTMRPLVIADTSVITAVPESRTDTFRLSVDGQSQPLPTGISLRISASRYVTLLARPCERCYLDTLRNKLLWGK